MSGIGINIGAASVKVAVTGDVNDFKIKAHEGDIEGTLKELLESFGDLNGIPALVTGGEGRRLVNLPDSVEALCFERVLDYLNLRPDALASLGGEELVLYRLNTKGRIVNNISGSKCASGTGEFFRHQLGRMNMSFDEYSRIPVTQVVPLSSRCSVFMKSDCTHRLNKKEAAREEIALSLSEIMAGKLAGFLERTGTDQDTVVLCGGGTANRQLLVFLKEKCPGIQFIVPPQAAYFAAFGAALAAEEQGAPLKPDQLFKAPEISFGRSAPLGDFSHRVTFLPETSGRIRSGADYVLGVDGGSTTTKVALVDRKDKSIAASHYGRTFGDPVKALRHCFDELNRQIKKEIGTDGTITISQAAVTGSSRGILGIYLGTEGVYNEIIAHAAGAAYFDPEVDTIFEIGGQDAKYIYLNNQVPVDYAMNEACSAGTGSFLEESASGDLNIQSAKDIGPLAMAAKSPLKFGEHCSAFINSDIRKAIQQGAGREDITAGLVLSVTTNYLNRVVGSRPAGRKIFLQGGVAKNPAMAPAFASALKREILVPPSPELTGCFGVALMAIEKEGQGLLPRGDFRLDADRQIRCTGEITCRACENLCPVKKISVDGHVSYFGGRCSRFTLAGQKAKRRGTDWTERRSRLMFETCAPDPQSFSKRRPFKIGLPRCFSYHSLYPFYAWFFHLLGIEVTESPHIDDKGRTRTESDYCFPAEIAHGAVETLLKSDADFIALPHFRDMPSYQNNVHANFCPITQSFPYYIRKAFPSSVSRFKDLIISFKFGREKAFEHVAAFARDLGIPDSESRAAFDGACARLEEYHRQAQKLGEQALREASEADGPSVVLTGRPYNAFTPEANMSIPRKFTERGVSVIPFDILPLDQHDSGSVSDNMYWYYGQQNLRAAALAAKDPNLYLTCITNFSCAPDSFILHYIRWLSGQKPFLALELDSHAADAGIDTRVEAFLDIVNGYRNQKESIKSAVRHSGMRLINKNKRLCLVDENQQEITVQGNPDVEILLANMDELATEMLAANIRRAGFSARALPPADRDVLHLARLHSSGKECVPSQLVLGSALRFLASEDYRKDKIYLLFVPVTSGPCRTGQYSVYYEHLFRDLRLDNLVVFTLSADNSYTELGPDFAARMWESLVISDYMKDIHNALRACAADTKAAMKTYRNEWKRLIRTAENNPRNIQKELSRIARCLSQIPLKQSPAAAPRVMVVGEIYVRRDSFAVDQLIETCSREGVIVKTAGIGEWIHYLDFVRKYDLKKRLNMRRGLRRIFGTEMRSLIKLRAEQWWKHRQERKISGALSATALNVPFPNDINKIMENSAARFVSLELNSEIAVSAGSAATAMQQGYSGVINISPFACLIGRVIEGIYAPWARDSGYPFISVEIDGNQLPPSLVNKLGMFLINVKRREPGSD